MSRVSPLQQFVGPIESRVGGFVAGERAVMRGLDLHKDLGQARWVDVYLYGITGRRFTEQQLNVLEAIWSYTSYPDTRLWNNRVAALAGSMRSTGNLGVAAGLAASEASVFGRQIDLRAMDFLERAHNARQNGSALLGLIEHELREHRSIAGYGRPLKNGDERIVPMMKLLEANGLGGGSYVALAFEIETLLLTGRWRFKMNYGALAAAICADFGLSKEEHYRFCFPAFLAGMHPCHMNAVQNPPGAVMPLACSDVSYDGAKARGW